MAQYVIKEADKQYETYKFASAIELYQEAYKKKATLHAAERLADCYRLNNNYAQAEAWYATAVAMPGCKPENILHYARMLQNNAKYAEAKIQYINYAIADSSVTAARKNTWLASCDSALTWIKEPAPVKVNNLKALNSPLSDWAPVPYMGGMVFTSDRNTNHPAPKKPVQLFLKFDTRNNPDPHFNGWTGNDYLHLFFKPEHADAVQEFPLNTGTDFHVGSASFTEDGNEIYFTLTRVPGKVKGALITVNIEIYSSKKDGSGNWSAPVAFPYNKVNDYSLGDPFISPDGNTLYFASNMPGGQGGTDIYVCTKNPAGEWGNPVNLQAINTVGNDRCPALGRDNTLFFSSDGRIGMGGLDIYSVQLGAGSAPVTNMRCPVNSPQDDFAFSPAHTDGIAFFSSNRDGGNGSDDIYSIIIPAKPALPVAVADTINKVPVTAPDSIATSAAVIAQTMPVKPGRMPVDTTPNTIYFDFGKFDIRADSRVLLNRMIADMKDNPGATMRLESHTDSRGNDALNLKLSQQRAAAVVKYLVERGIEKSKIEAKGYGETVLLNKCGNGVYCTEEEHQLNRRTQIKIVQP